MSEVWDPDLAQKLQRQSPRSSWGTPPLMILRTGGPLGDERSGCGASVVGAGADPSPADRRVEDEHQRRRSTRRNVEELGAERHPDPPILCGVDPLTVRWRHVHPLGLRRRSGLGRRAHLHGRRWRCRFRRGRQRRRGLGFGRLDGRERCVHRRRDLAFDEERNGQQQRRRASCVGVSRASACTCPALSGSSSRTSALSP